VVWWWLLVRCTMLWSMFDVDDQRMIAD